MKKVSILALHLGYEGIEKCISSLANIFSSMQISLLDNTSIIITP